LEWGPEWKRYHAVSEMMTADGKAAALCAQLFEFLVTLSLSEGLSFLYLSEELYGELYERPYDKVLSSAGWEPPEDIPARRLQPREHLEEGRLDIR
jgi:hypothetical protein